MATDATGQERQLPPLNFPPEALQSQSGNESAVPSGDQQATNSANSDDAEQASQRAEQSAGNEPNAAGSEDDPSQKSAEQGTKSQDGDGTGEKSEDGSDGTGPEPKKRRNRITERIQQLNTQRREAERVAEDANRRAERAEQAYQKLHERMSEAAQFDDDDYEGQQAHRTRQLLTEDRMEAAAEERDRAIEERDAALELEQDVRNATFMTKLEDATDRFPTLIEDFRTVPVTEVGAEFIADSDNAAEIAHYLTANRAEARRIASMSAPAQQRELARIEIRITEAPKARKVSQAPAPTPKVKGTASPQIKDPNDPSLSFEEYRAIRRAEMEAENKRS